MIYSSLVAERFPCVRREVAVNERQTHPDTKKHIQGQHDGDWQVDELPLVGIV